MNTISGMNIHSFITGSTGSRSPAPVVNGLSLSVLQPLAPVRA